MSTTPAAPVAAAGMAVIDVRVARLPLTGDVVPDALKVAAVAIDAAGTGSKRGSGAIGKSGTGSGSGGR